MFLCFVLILIIIFYSFVCKYGKLQCIMYCIDPPPPSEWDKAMMVIAERHVCLHKAASKLRHRQFIGRENKRGRKRCMSNKDERSLKKILTASHQVEESWSHLPRDCRALHASILWQALWKCPFPFPAHRARTTANWFADADITVLDWPAFSPDPEPLENLWGNLEGKMRNTQEYREADTWSSARPQHWTPPCHCTDAVIYAKGTSNKSKRSKMY